MAGDFAPGETRRLYCDRQQAVTFFPRVRQVASDCWATQNRDRYEKTRSKVRFAGQNCCLPKTDALSNCATGESADFSVFFAFSCRRHLLSAAD